MSLIHFYQGTHFHQRGQPLIVMTATHSGFAGSGEVFVFLRKFPTRSYEMVKSLKMEFSAAGPMMDLLDTPNPDEFVVTELLDWTAEYLRAEQDKDFQANKDPMVLHPIELKRETAWETSLVRMRLRGLTDAQLVELSNQTSDETLKILLKNLKALEPERLREM
jgi:hypothetical protein